MGKGVGVPEPIQVRLAVAPEQNTGRRAAPRHVLVACIASPSMRTPRPISTSVGVWLSAQPQGQGAGDRLQIGLGLGARCTAGGDPAQVRKAGGRQQRLLPLRATRARDTSGADETRGPEGDLCA